jgi:SAM-dependent methyltransferase
MKRTGQTTSGVRAVFSRPRVYSLVQALIGGDRARRIMVDEYLAPTAKLDVIDLGCGPGDLVPHLETQRYVGYDPSEAYIAAARRRHGARGEFHVAGVERVAELEARRFDLAIAIGVLHHLDDRTAAELFRAARAVLRAGGRCVTFDPVLVPGQHRLARALVRLDRGRHVRDEAGYARLARTAFTYVDVHHRDDLLHVPYNHIALVCVA